MLKRKPKVLTPEQVEEIRTRDFFDMILPGTIKFLSDHYIVGDSYRCVWAIREYPPSTEEQAILSQLADRNGVTLRIYHRLVESMEQRKIIQNATRRNRLKSGGNDVSETIEAEGNLQEQRAATPCVGVHRTESQEHGETQGIAERHRYGTHALQDFRRQAHLAAERGLSLCSARGRKSVRRTVRTSAARILGRQYVPV